ncbi:hypothetical protein PFISCL1PPCAC_11430 [Pristionchus fissidentatus]|uniref:Uncharacterized protein n=1 Tax=Pristionchus fissidentatus TaxID=1538716 RepID=A0AAV5VL64_9BILA|nr:hypothetical protein PFISCL1PPCAC_11430 [Pristionchus fissidentatus]
MRALLIFIILFCECSSETINTEKLINALKVFGTFNETAVSLIVKKIAVPALIPIQEHVDTCTVHAYRG